MLDAGAPHPALVDVLTRASSRACWWQEAIIYQIYPRSFKDSNGDGVGDLPGISGQLEYLRWLGVDAIWISPFYPSPMADFGYDVSNYTDVDPLFGDLATFDNLVRQAHQHHIKVIIDVVLNHTSIEHPWFLESRASRENPKRAWYYWADPKPDGSPPNNWLSVFNGPAWAWDAETGQYYLHSFLPQQPDLNWHNPAVREAMFDVLRFWLERGVDGFRLDAAHYIMKDPLLRDNPLREGGKEARHVTGDLDPFLHMGEYDMLLHLYDKGYPEGHGFFRALRQVVDGYSAEAPRVTLGELHIFDWPKWATYYGAALDELHMPLNFGLINTPWQASFIRALVDSVEAALPGGAWPNYVLGNHDESRVATRLGPAQARVGMLLLLTLRGTPTLYYGDELGLGDVEVPAERIQDPLQKITAGYGRDPERTPMQWTGDPNAGFCAPSVEPWLPVAIDYGQVNVAAQRLESHSMLTFTQTLIHLRRTMPALRLGSYQSVRAVPEGCFVYLRAWGEQRCVVTLNFTEEAQSIQTVLGKGKILLSTHSDREGVVDLASFRLRGHEGCLIVLEGF
jgi:alpha-glucosidase